MNDMNDQITVSCRINGADATLHGDPAGSTVSALRARGLYGVRETCGLGVCGTCTVLLDGEPVSTCILPLYALNGRTVQTVEGAASGETLSGLQRQFIESQAFQCSFCTPGFLASAQALLEQSEGELTRQEVEDGLQGHLCRCGSYEAINEAVRICSRNRGCAPGTSAGCTAS
jgi:aerobic-type carbon monoxide dehydrogenase small subunit (CoxS/CutS family)